VTSTAPGRRRRHRRRLKVVIGLVLVAAIGTAVYLNLRKAKRVPTFPAVAVQRADLVDRLAETGSIELVRTVEVKSTVAGEVRKLFVEAGEWVKTGQPMAVIDPDPNQSLLLYQKRSAVERGEINLREQEREFERKQSLFARGMLPAQEFEAAQTQLTRARNDLRLAQLELAILETKANLGGTEPQRQAAELDEVRVLAPIGGIVTQRGVEVGEVVASGLSSYTGGTVLFVIGDPSQMVIRGDIAEVDIGSVRVGQEVDIVVDAYPDTTYRGRVRWVAPVGQRKQNSPLVTFDAEIDILDRDPRLRQGMSCDIDIVLARRDSAVCLPVEAVRRIEPEDRREDEGQGRAKPRFVAYRVRPDAVGAAVAAAGVAGAAGAGTALAAVADTAAAGSAARPAASGGTAADSAGGDSAAAGKKPPEPPRFPLTRFEEVELEVGLETSTRLQIVAGLREGDLVAQDAEAVHQAREEAEHKGKPGGGKDRKDGR